MSLSNNVLEKDDDFGFKPFPSQSPQKDQPNLQEDDFGFKPFQKPTQTSPLEDEGNLEREIERSQAQLTSRGLETIAGLPGDLINFISHITGAKPVKRPPTSKELREFSEKSSLGYTKPQTEFEERAGEVAQDVASLMIPGSNSYGILRNIGIPIAANLAKEGLSNAGVGEGGQNAAKTALMIGLDLLSQKKSLSGKMFGDTGKAYAGTFFEKAKSKLPKGQKIEVSGLSSDLSNVKTILQQGGSRPSTAKALEKIKDFEGDIVKGKIDVRNLYEYRPAINEIIDELGGFSFGGKTAIKEKAIHNLNQVKGKIISTLEEYGEKFNPEFLGPYKEAQQAFAVASKSNVISNFLEKKFGNVIKNPIIKTLFGLSGHGLHAGISAASPVAGVGILAGKGMYDAGKLFYRIIKSPTLAKYYGKVMSGALAGNTAETLKNLQALEKELEKEDITPQESNK